MIILDTETSGVDAYKDSLVSVGAIEFENPKNEFYAECRIWEGAHIDDKSLTVNGFSREQITDQKKKTDREVLEEFLEWTYSCGERTLVGQNPSFDESFLKATAERYHINWPLAKRTIDLHSVVYFDMLKKGLKPPTDEKMLHSKLNLSRILEYVGMKDERKKHNALEDAKLEAETFRRLIYGK